MISKYDEATIYTSRPIPAKWLAATRPIPAKWLVATREFGNVALQWNNSFETKFTNECPSVQDVAE